LGKIKKFRLFSLLLLNVSVVKLCFKTYNKNDYTQNTEWMEASAEILDVNY